MVSDLKSWRFGLERAKLLQEWRFAKWDASKLSRDIGTSKNTPRLYLPTKQEPLESRECGKSSRLGIRISKLPKSNLIRRNSIDKWRLSYRPSLPLTKKRSKRWEIDSLMLRQVSTKCREISTWCRRTWRKCSWGLFVPLTLRQWASSTQLIKLVPLFRCRKNWRNKFSTPWLMMMLKVK